MGAFTQDLMLAVRSSMRRPGFLMLATTTIAIGIAAVTTIFSVIDAVLLTPLPYADSDRIVRLGQRSESGDRMYSMSYLDFRDFQERASSFDALAATRTTRVTVQGEAGPEALPGAFVAADFFDVMGAQPALGRAFTREEDLTEAAVVVLSHGIWRTRWGSDPSIVGTGIELDDEVFTVVGVMPAGFTPPEGLGMFGTAVWMPLARVDPVARDSRSDGFLTGVGRLAANVTPQATQAEVDGIGTGLREAWPEESGDKHWGIRPLLEQTVGTTAARLTPILGAVGFLLLIGCVNVANLMLVRASERKREFALRTAIGASRGRLVRQLFTESLLIGVVGAVVGIGLAALGVQLFVSYNPGDVPRLAEVRLDGSVLGFAALISVLATIMFGLAPALGGTRGVALDGLRDGTHGGGVSAGQERLRGGLVVFETSLALVLVVGAGLLAGSFVRMNQVELGFEPEGVHAMRVTYPDSDPEAIADFFERVLEGVRALPGVHAAGATAVLPVSGNYMYQRLFFDASASEEEGYPVKYQEVSDGYFETVRMALVRGRGFDDRDTRGGALVAVVSEAMAREISDGNGDVVGRVFELREGSVLPGSYEIIGVVEDARLRGIRDDVESEVYFSARQLPRRGMDVVAHADEGGVALLRMMRDEVWNVRSDIPVVRQTLLTDYVAGSIAPERFYAGLLVGFASLAMLLALVGIYGTLSYSVSQRMREVGIRMALGASQTSVVSMVVRRGVLLAGMGVILGTLAAIPLTRLVEAFVFGASPTDPGTMAGAVVLVLVTAALASVVPARRATRPDLVEVLRGD